MHDVIGCEERRRVRPTGVMIIPLLLYIIIKDEKTLFVCENFFV